jgi:hypothetical protein
VESPVMHRAETDRNITPTTKQQIGAGSGSIPTSNVDAAQLDTETDVTPVHSDPTIDVTPGGPSLRWSAFEDTLKQRREDVLQSSIDNAKRADREVPPLHRKAG